MRDKILDIVRNKRIVILGFGKEGQSSFNFLKTFIPLNQFNIADKSEGIRQQMNPAEMAVVNLSLGEQYLEGIKNADLIIKSPGIPKELLRPFVPTDKITSQADLFIRFYAGQIIGITGTKGKSTTSSLVQHIFEKAGKDAVLVGNIGKPPFDYIQSITKETQIVYELSSHQLDDVHFSPHIAIILNLFEEHLDHYGSFIDYKNAKFNISKFQNTGDWLIVNGDDHTLQIKYEAMNSNTKLIFSRNKHPEQGAFISGAGMINLLLNDSSHTYNFDGRKALPGDHNLMNIMAAALATKLSGIEDEPISEAVYDFKGLAHRLEYVGKFKGIHFYNDSIATIPQATIEAVKTLKKVDTLILGGKDRGINYSSLISFLPDSEVRNLIFLGEAGKRIYKDLKIDGKFKGNMFLINKFEEIKGLILKNTLTESICLLSPAASSYDMFQNFEERGNAFKIIAENL
jgi:UDP-N-acetylmuramoylalanine--D-glutamate ligase